MNINIIGPVCSLHIIVANQQKSLLCVMQMPVQNSGILDLNDLACRDRTDILLLYILQTAKYSVERLFFKLQSI